MYSAEAERDVCCASDVRFVREVCLRHVKTEYIAVHIVIRRDEVCMVGIVFPVDVFGDGGIPIALSCFSFFRVVYCLQNYDRKLNGCTGTDKSCKKS